MRGVLICIHDVSPAHKKPLTQILDDLKTCHVGSVNLGVVPNFHGDHDLTNVPLFTKWLCSLNFKTEFLLHGYYHKRLGENKKLSTCDSLTSKLVSAGEDEFFRLSMKESDKRIAWGIKLFREALHTTPRGFIPPAWMIEPSHMNILFNHGIQYTENHRYILKTETHVKLISPIFSYATRSFLRKNASLCFNALLKRTIGKNSIIRFVIHPNDYRSERVRQSIVTTVQWLTRRYDVCLYRDIV